MKLTNKSLPFGSRSLLLLALAGLLPACVVKGPLGTAPSLASLSVDQSTPGQQTLKIETVVRIDHTGQNVLVGGESKVSGSAASEHTLAAAPSHDNHASWDYQDPSVWGSLDPSFAIADEGTRQSPIDLTDPVHGDLKGLEFAYQPFALDVEDNGHSLVVKVPEGHFANLGGRVFELKNVHFHTPSEHALDGQRFAMEVHFVHADDAGNLGVVGVFVEEGRENEAFEKVLDAVDGQGHSAGHSHGTSSEPSIDVTGLMPNSKLSVRYHGSLTTPPCSEGVQWFVLTQPMEFSAEQVGRFRDHYSMNARPLQPLNGRWILSR